LALYAEKLQAFPFDLVQTTIDQLIETHESTSPPALGVILRRVRARQSWQAGDASPYRLAPVECRALILVRLERTAGTWSETRPTEENIRLHWEQFRGDQDWPPYEPEEPFAIQ
ncbi:unnamed protein product, partial [marine sediment metagenome]